MNRTRPIVNQKLTNRLLAAVVSLFLLLGLVPLTVLADSYGPQGEGFKVNEYPYGSTDGVGYRKVPAFHV